MAGPAARKRRTGLTLMDETLGNERSASPGGSVWRTLRVLVVEGDATLAAEVRHALAEAGPKAFELEHRPLLDGALERLAERPFDVLLLHLPRLNPPSADVLRHLVEAAPRYPIVVLFDEADEERGALLAMQMGAQEFIARRHVHGRMLIRTLRYAVERRRYAEALAESEARFRRLAENAPDLIYRLRLRPDRAFEYVSPAATALTGHGPAEHARDPDLWRRLIHPDDRSALERLERGEADWRSPLLLRWTRADGSTVWTEHRVTPLRNEFGAVVAVEGIARDVTLRIEQEQALRETRAQMEAAQKLETVGRLAGGVAHDFNNILTAVTGYAELLLDQLDLEDPKRKLVLAIHRAAERAAGLTRQMLAFGRRQILKPRPLDLNEMVREVAEVLPRMLGEDIVVELRLAPVLRPTIADPGQIEQVLLNLVTNARDAMPNGGTLTIETAEADLDEAAAVAAGGVKPGPFVRLSVTDTGIGMDAATRARIFEPFFTTKPKGQGTGLGLSMAYGIVRQSEGAIVVDSEPGRGSTFTVYLPRAADAPSAPPHAPAPEPDRRGGRESILLVEDEPGVRELARAVLEARGYAVEIAADGEEALAVYAARGRPVDLLVTDVVMPRLGGAELSRRLQAAQPGLRVLFMSGYTEDAAIRQGLHASAIAFLEKPFSPTTLAARVRELLDRT